MPSLSDEVTFISALNPDGTLALNAYYAWNRDNPATYTGGYTQAAKWYGTPSANVAGTPGGVVDYYFNPASNWSAVEKQDFIAGLALWSAIANISFVQTTNQAQAQITITRGSDGNAETTPTWAGTADAGLTGGTKLLQITSATISIDTSVIGFGPITSSFTTDGGYPWQTLLHEEGHVLGLGHAGPYPLTSVSNSSTLQYSPYDSRLWSIMSYIDPWDTTAPYFNQYPVGGTNWGTTTQGNLVFHNEATTWMPLDILAAQRIYGLPTSTPLSGGQVFGFQSNITGAIAPFFDFTQNTTPVVTLWDMGTGNTLNLTGFSSNSSVNLNPGTFSSCDGLVNNICIAFNTAIDSLYTGAGNDILIGNNDGDYLSGGGGNDTITGGSGNDTLVGGTGTNTLDGGGGRNTAVFSGNYASYAVTLDTVSGRDTVSGLGESDALTNIAFLQFADQTISTIPSQVIVGTNGNDTLTGGPGDDFIRGGLGTDTIDGGPGNDTAAFSLPPGYYDVSVTANGYFVQGPGPQTDTLINIENASFDATGQTLSLAQFASQSFNPLVYIASYPDLIKGAGDNQQVGLQHFIQHGYYEGRSPGTFNVLQYIASYPDLIKGAGDNQTVGLEHYILHGYYEGRVPTFNVLQYIASYPDLVRGAGDNQTIGLEHYILHGYYEGRVPTFNALQYIASYPDLIRGAGDNQTVGLEHYILHGYYEGRVPTFNALQYIASYADLIRGAGDNQTVGLEHYILHGYYEGRTATFDAIQYIASYDDLIRGAGDNATVGLEHYILHGYYEGRTPTFDAVAYLLSNPDLQNGQYDAQAAELQFVQTGFYQGRSRSGAFGTEQTQHALTLGVQASDSLATSGDEDWFSINLTAGQSYNLTLSGNTTGGLADPYLELHNANGVLVAQDNDSGPGADALIHLTASSSGTYYLVARSNVVGGTGNYNILVS